MQSLASAIPLGKNPERPPALARAFIRGFQHGPRRRNSRFQWNAGNDVFTPEITHMKTSSALIVAAAIIAASLILSGGVYGSSTSAANAFSNTLIYKNLQGSPCLVVRHLEVVPNALGSGTKP